MQNSSVDKNSCVHLFKMKFLWNGTLAEVSFQEFPLFSETDKLLILVEY